MESLSFRILIISCLSKFGNKRLFICMSLGKTRGKENFIKFIDVNSKTLRIPEIHRLYKCYNLFHHLRLGIPSHHYNENLRASRHLMIIIYENSVYF